MVQIEASRPEVQSPTGDEFDVHGPWVRCVLAAAVATASIVIWWGIRTEERERAEEGIQQQVDAEIVLIRQQLERLDQTATSIAAVIAEAGLESEAARALLGGLDAAPANSVEPSAFVLAAGLPDRSQLAFSSDEFQDSVVNSEVLHRAAELAADGAVAFAAPIQSPRGTEGDTVAEPLSAAIIARPVPNQSDDETNVLLVVAPLGSDAEILPIQFAYQADVFAAAEPKRPVDLGAFDRPATEVSVGSHRWSLQPLNASIEPSHTGSDFFWATGVIITAFTFFFRRSPQGTGGEDHEALLHGYYRLIDPVTGSLNTDGVRRELEIRVRRRRRSGQVGVLLCGLDRYDSIKQSFPPAVVDDLFRTAFERIHSLLSGSDSCGRLGESQLLVMTNSMPTTSDLEALASKIGTEFSDPIELSDGTICHISFSIGVASLRSPEISATDLLADVALAQGQAAQHGGGSYVVFSAEQRQQAMVERQLEQELLGAVGSDGLSVHYQAVMELGENPADEPTVNKVEAFVRWSHELRGMVHPQQFLPLAISAGVDMRITEFVLRQACTQALTWSSEVGRPISVNVNIGERQLSDLRLVALVRRVLADVGLPAVQLELDISEDLLLRRGVGTSEVLQQLGLIGVKISLDNFGASSGSLQHLGTARSISTVKIDREVVADVADNAVTQKVIAAVASVAEQGDLEVIAEGVETPAQMRALHALNIRRVQGFLYHRPGPADTVGKKLPRSPSVGISAKART